MCFIVRIYGKTDGRKNHSDGMSFLYLFLSYAFLDRCITFRKETGRPCASISSWRAALRLASMKSSCEMWSFRGAFLCFMAACESRCFPLQGHRAQHAGGTQRLAAGPPHRYGIVRQRLHIVAEGRGHLNGDMGFAALEQAGGDDGRPVAVPVTADLLAVDGHFGHAVDLPQTEEPVLFGRHADHRRVGDDAGEIRRPPVLRKIEERRIFKREHRAVHLFKADVPCGDDNGIGRGMHHLRLGSGFRHLRAFENDQPGAGFFQRDAQQTVFRDVQFRPVARLRIPEHRCPGRMEARYEEMFLHGVTVDDEIEVGTRRAVLDLGHIR